MPLSFLPMVITYVLMLVVSLRRLAAFFGAAELQPDAVQTSASMGTPLFHADRLVCSILVEESAMRLDKASFTWGRAQAGDSKSEDRFGTAPLNSRSPVGRFRRSDTTMSVDSPPPLALKDISIDVNAVAGSVPPCSRDLKAKPGSLVAVVGRVGAGKSSLLSAICGELDRKGGQARLSVRPPCSQPPRGQG